MALNNFNSMRKIINVLILLITLLLLGFYMRICLIRFNVYSYKKELPLIGIQDIIKFENKIYIGLSQFNRIQVYDLNGQFIKFIPTNNYHKDFSFKVNYNEDIIINVFYREHTKIVFLADSIKYYLEKKYPAHIYSIKQKKKESYIENNFFLLAFNSDTLLLVLIIISIGFFYVFNSSIIHKHLDKIETKNFKLYKNIIIEIFK